MEDLREILETKDVEFKEKFGENMLKTLCAFANTNGGKVILGVDDKGVVKGFKIDNKVLKDITEKIVSALGIHPDIEIKEKDGKPVVIISVKKSNIPVSFRGKYYERVGNTTREMNTQRLKEFFIKGTNWDGIINENADFNEIDEETVRLFIRMARAKRRLLIFEEDVEIGVLFEHLKLAINGKLTNAALMLFGKDPQKYFINAVLRIVRLKNESTIVGDRFIAGNLFNQVIQGEEAIKNFLNVKYEIKGFQREEIWVIHFLQ